MEPAETEEAAPRTVIIDLDEAREPIIAALRRDAAVARADAAATELAFRSIPDRDGRIPSFIEEAEQVGVEAVALSPFTRLDIPLEDAGPGFAAAAFDLEENAFDRVSIPVTGQEKVYVIHLESIQPPRIPDFEEVAERANEMARQRAVTAAMLEKAEALRKAAQEGRAQGLGLAESLADWAVNIVTLDPFTGLSASSSDDFILQALVQTVVAYNTGEITEPIRTPEGLLVAHIASRTPGDPASFGAYRDEIASAIRGRRAQGLFADWQATLLEPDRFTDFQRQTLPEEDGEDDSLADEEAEAAAYAD